MPLLSLAEVMQLAVKAHQEGRLKEADYYYRQVLPHDPENPRLLYLLGLLCHQTERQDEALQLLNQAIGLSPEDAEFYNTRGEVFRRQGNNVEARKNYERSLKLQPDYAEAMTNLGSSYQLENNLSEAERLHHQARQLNPNSPVILNNLGTVLDRSLRRAEAQDCYRQAIEINPSYLKARINLIRSLLDERQYQTADEESKKALLVFPEAPELWLWQARSLKESDRTTEAILILEKHEGQFQEFHNEALTLLAGCHHSVGDLDACLATHQRILLRDPDNHYSTYTRLTSLNYSIGHEAEQLFQEHLKFTQRFYPIAPGLKPPTRNETDPNRPLKLGYISNDFKNHSVSHFILPVIEQHDAARFIVHCFALNEGEDRSTHRYQRATRHWHKSWTQTDAELAEEIGAAEIDILVDLGGLFGARLGLLARQVAPVQVCFLGYPNTTGLTTVQYRITDAVADPVGLTGPYYTEQLWRLPGSAWCYQPLDAQVEIGPLPADRFGHITFGCFHGIHKYRPIMLEAWAQILAQIPNSLLLLKSFKGLGQSETRAKFRLYFEKVGVDLNRIKFVPSSVGEFEHLQLFNNIDLALDTFPYHGTTITCEALWMGVPSITLAGPTHVSRVGVSLLTHAGVPEGIAHSVEEYVLRAIALAGNLPRLREIRQDLRTRMKATALGNPEIYTRQLEEAYAKMFQLASGPPMVT